MISLGHVISYGIATNSTKADKDIAQCRRFVLDWKDIEAAATTLPEYEEKAKFLIKSYLSYLPPLSAIYIPYEPFIRSLIAAFQEQRLAEEVFACEAEFQMKKIRNDDMKKHGWAKEGAFTKEDYEYYNTCLPQFKQAAKERLHELLGYQPVLEYSLGAEIYLRQLFTMDKYYTGMPYCTLDYRAMVICRYQQQILVEGQEKAGESSLLGVALSALTGTKPYSFLKKDMLEITR